MRKCSVSGLSHQVWSGTIRGNEIFGDEEPLWPGGSGVLFLRNANGVSRGRLFLSDLLVFRGGWGWEVRGLSLPRERKGTGLWGSRPAPRRSGGWQEEVE